MTDISKYCFPKCLISTLFALQLSQYLDINPPIQLTTTETPVDTKCFVSGFGFKENSGFNIIPTFREVNIVKCNDQPQSMICAADDAHHGVLCQVKQPEII